MEIIPYLEEINIYVEKLKKELAPELIILFGSLAKKNFGLGSDIDIIVVSNNFSKNFQVRLKNLFLLNETFLPIEAIGYTVKEFKNMLKKGNPIILDAMNEGVVLYEKGSIFSEMKKLFENLKKGFIKVDFGWIRKKS